MVKRKKGKRRGFLILLLFLAFLALLLPGKRGILNQVRVRLQKRQLEKEIRELKTTQAKLEKQIEALQKPETVEKIAREEYGMAKKDEKVYRVVPRENE